LSSIFILWGSMPLELIIDGYNLIRQSDTFRRLDARSLEQGREALLLRLADYQKIRSHPITVVFDGWGGVNLESTIQRLRGITVIFTRKGEKADDWIKRKLEQMQYGAVVTSDRDIRRYAERLGIADIPSRLFERRMEAALFGGQKEIELDEEEREEEFIEAKRKGPARRLSKQERRRQAVLAKL
jgi:predicted RNA-binding protein with PIN domain